MGDDENTSRIRGADWIFNALWTSCGDPQIPKCSINIPITFIFRDGVPIKCLRTSNSGLVERVQLEHNDFMERKRGEKGLQGESMKQLRILRKLLVEYCKDNEYDYAQNELTDPKLCRICYTDGEIEEIKLSAFDSLLRSETWRLQVLLVQGFVPFSSRQDGHYYEKARIQSKLITDGAEATNQYTRALAKYAERAYTSSESSILGVDSYAASTKIVVKELHGNFVFDHLNRVVFLGTQYLTIAIVGNRRAMEDYMADEKRAREMTAARSVAQELRQLLQHAQKRGLSPELSFAHFDTEKTGFIDIEMLVNGMSKLGIGVTHPVAELLMQIIGGVGSNYLNIRDMQHFINEPDLEVFESMGATEIQNKKPSSAGDARKASGRGVRSVDSVRHMRSERREQRAQQMAFSQSLEGGDSSASLFQQSSTDSRTRKRTKKSRGATRSSSTSSGPTELPIPEDAYKVNAPQTKTTDLPPWASKRQKRALRELQRTHKSWTKRKEEELNFYDDATMVSNDGMDVMEPMDSPSLGANLPQSPTQNSDRVSSSRQQKHPRSAKRTTSSSSSRPHSRPASAEETKHPKNLLDLSLESDVRNCPDDMLHVDHGVMMTYRVLKGRGSNEALKTHEENRLFRMRSILELRERNLREKCKEPDSMDIYGELSTDSLNLDGVEKAGTERRWISFTIVAVPDLFMCLQTMEKYLSPILERYPLARLVLAGLPGLPHTHWPRGWVLNSDLHARSIGSLIQHLKTSQNPNNWSPVEDEPIVFLSFGSGAHATARFITSVLPSMKWMQPHIQAVVTVNGFAKMPKNYKRVCKELRESMLTATPPEINELVASLHFWDEYLVREGREHAMDEFWSTRKGLVDKSKLDFTSQQVHQVGGLGYTGVLEQLRGLLIGPDDPDIQSSLLHTRIPLLVIQCTEDVFVEPQHAGMIFSPQNLKTYNRDVVKDIKDLLRPGAVMVNWLRGGHEALQERSSFLLATLNGIAQALGLESHVNADVSKEEPTFVNPYDDFDIEELMAGKSDEPEPEDQEQADESKVAKAAVSVDLWLKKLDAQDNEEEEDEFAPKERKEAPKKDTATESAEDIVVEEGEEEEKWTRTEDDAAKIERKAREKLARKTSIAERRKREVEAQKEAERAAMHEKQRKLLEQKREAKELFKMAKEDERSLFVEEHWYEVEQQVKNAELAKKRADELFLARRAEAVKRVEDQMAIDRALRLEERRKHAEAVAKQIEAEELQMEGEREGGYEAKESDGPNVLIAATQRLLKDITECKQKLVEAMKRQMLIEQKTLQYRNQKSGLENEIRKLRQAIQLITKDRLMAGMGISKNETDELQRNLASKEDTFREFCMVGKVREDQLDAANRSVQLLKVSLQERETLMAKRIKQLQGIEKRQTSKIRKFKLDLEHSVLKKDDLRSRRVHHAERVKNLGAERMRLKGHKAEFVDSDTLIPGVLQRCVTKDLKKHLKNEHDKEKNKVNAIDEEVDKVNDEIEMIAIKQEKVIRDCAKISLAIRVFHRVISKVQKHSVMDILQDLNSKSAAAEKIEHKRSLEGPMDRTFGLENSTPAERLRLKEADLRTKEERKFIAIDMILHPDEYKHLSTTELEEMKFDPDYQIDLEAPDLARINKLPEQIALALPFLSTLDEIEAHRLMNKFYRGKGDEYYKRCDYYCSENHENTDEDASLYSTSTAVASIYLSPEEMREAEAVHDILIKESRRDRVRSLGAGDKLSDSEKLWLSMDRVLSPYIYAGSVSVNQKSNFSGSYVRDGRTDGTNLRFEVVPKNNHDRPKDGDKYEEMRWRYENGEIVFESDEFKCPFTREELLTIRSTPLDELDSTQRKFRDVMDMYYVHEDESLYGHSRMESMCDVSSELSKFIAAQDSLDVDSASRERSRTRSMSSVDDEEGSIRRIYGSWEVVHPASASVESQNSFFHVSSYSCTRDHPASYAKREIDDDDNPFDIFGSVEEEEEEEGEMSPEDRIEKGVEALLSLPGRRKRRKKKNNSLYYIVESPKVLAQQDPKSVSGKVVLITHSDRQTLWNIDNQELAQRQSRSHRFDIPDKDELHVLEFSVTIMYQGSFGNKGYRLGRIAAGLFRLPDAKPGETLTGGAAIPQPVGFAPYDLQSPNLPDSMGRIVLVHKPKSRPIPSGTYQIVLGAASTTRYSIEVSCRYAQNALTVIDPLVIKAKEMQARLPVCLRELDELHTGLRLAERKLLVTRKMIVEAEAETQRCQKAISIVTEKLARDDETMEYTEDERRDLMREQGILEVEFAQWANTYASRCREKSDIKEGIEMMHRMQRERQEEKTKIKDELTELRRDLPTCVSLLRTYQEAANIAITLNTTVQGRGAAVASETFSTAAGTAARIVTPADVVRRRYRREGWEALSLEEQQWTMLDMSLAPHKYEWLSEKEEEENFKRMEMGKKPKKKKKYNLAIEQYRLNKVEIGRIMAQPFAMLTRREMNVRKLLQKFHDDADIIRRSKAQAAFSFDPKRAERTRSKQYAAMTKEEKEWSSIDKVLHPEVWAYYHHDDDTKNWLDRKGKGATLREFEGMRPNTFGSITTADSQSQSTAPGTSASMGGGGTMAPPASQNSSVVGSAGHRSNVKASYPGTAATGVEPKAEEDLAETLGRILDPDSNSIQEEAAHRRKSVGLADIVNDVNKAKEKDASKSKDGWRNRFDRDHLIRIWKQTNPQLLKNDEERHAYRLMQKYNGSYGAYVEMALEAQRRRKNDTKLGSHVRWDAHGITSNPDVDARAREVLVELDRAMANKNFWMDSLVLHTNDQRFPTEVLRLQLEEELDTILADQVRERERVDRMTAAQKGQNDETDESDSSDESDEVEESMTMSKIQSRAKRRDKRRTKLKKATLKDEVQVARKMILQRNKTGEALDEALIMGEIGVMGCLACRSEKCKWQPTVDEDACQARIKELRDEIERVRSDPEAGVFYSTVALSAQLGGGTAFERDDLFNELSFEIREIERRVHLNNIDKELHDAFATRSEYVEVRHLHGYSTVLWTNNARKALGARQERLVAMNVAHEIVDDILEHMLEGWYFGERESKFSLAGYVPSVKKDGFMKAGQEQVQSVAIAVAKAKKRRDDRYKGIISFEAMRGELEEKLMPIENNMRVREEDKRIAKEGTDHWHRLNETESTLKFGLFMLTFMYFRAMAFLSREKRSWAGDDDPVNNGGKGSKKSEMTEERRKMIEEESKLAARQKKMDLVLARAKEGELRKSDREAHERREATQKLQEMVRRQRREKECINCIQRVYRGHLGRKAARRWAMKRAELTAINALLNAAATCLQRVWRGYLARVEAIETRAEMAYFIALMRAQEAEQDEEEYWETHQLQRYKRNFRNFVNEQFRQEHAFKTLGAPELGADQFDVDDDDD